MKVVDFDADAFVEYSFADSFLVDDAESMTPMLAEDLFEIGRFTGNIHLKRRLDFESMPSFLLGIQVRNSTT